MDEDIKFDLAENKPVIDETKKIASSNRIVDDLIFEAPQERPNIIKVVGVGGGGSNAVNHMFTEGIKGVDFVLCNTDYQALEKSPVATKIHLGKRELGAGNVPSVGRSAAEESIEEIKSVLSDNTKMLFITAGMGGGTGTGAAPIVANVAHELGILTVGIVTLPFKCEGRRRMQQATDGINEMRKHVDTLLIVSNDKLREEYGDMKLTEAFKKADDVLRTAAKGIAEIITVPGYVNVDFEDVNTVMRGSGRAIMGSGYAEGDDRAIKAIEEAMHSPLLNDSNISGAKNILIYITSGDDEVSLDEVVEITEYVQKNTGETAEVIWGNGIDEKLGKKIGVTVIATGFNNKKDVIIPVIGIEPSSAIIYDLDENPANTFKKNTITSTGTSKQSGAIVHEIDSDDSGSCSNDDQHDDAPSFESPTNGKRYYNLYDEDETKPSKVDSNIVSPSEPSRSNDSTKRFENPFHKTSSDDDIYNRYGNAGNNSLQNSAPISDVAVEEKQTIANQQYDERRERLRRLSNYKTEKGLNELEAVPAYIREQKKIQALDNTDEELSNYASSKDQGIISKNTFLHHNVD